MNIASNPSKVKQFRSFIQLFDSIDFPYTLHSEAHHEFSTQNKSIHPELIQAYITPFIGQKDDEFTEYIPCFLLDQQKNYIAIVVWRASLLEYTYFVLTYNNAGDLIHKQVIGGMKSNGQKVLTRMAMIDDEKNIHMVEGELNDNHQDYDATQTKEYTFFLNEDGILELEH